MFRRLAFVLATIAAVSLLHEGVAPRWAQAAADVVITAEPLAWSKSNRVYAVKIVDAMRGSSFSVRELKGGKEVDNAPFTEDDEKRVWARLKKKHELTGALHAGQASESGEVTVLDKAAGDRHVILVMYDGMVGELARIELPQDPRGSSETKARVKSVHWADRDKWLIVVINHRFEGQMGEDRDTPHVFAYRRWKVDWK